MRPAVLTIFLLSFAALDFAQTAADELQRFREIRDRSFRSASETPLTTEDFRSFKGLEYFETSEKFVVKARLEKTADAQIFLMPTSVGTTRRYLKYGILTFELDGKSFSLTAFQSEGAAAGRSKTIFVPFKDQTNGAETYAAGRYLDIRLAADDAAVIDFNFAYNPLCAYGRDDFSCALPPKENFLQIEIKAGEKMYAPAAKKQ